MCATLFFKCGDQPIAIINDADVSDFKLMLDCYCVYLMAA
jgi:hypothetical protein